MKTLYLTDRELERLSMLVGLALRTQGPPSNYTEHLLRIIERVMDGTYCNEREYLLAEKRERNYAIRTATKALGVEL